MSTHADVGEALTKLAFMANSPIKDDEEAISAVVENYLEILADFPPDVLELAVLSFRATGNAFFPQPGQIRQEAIKLLMQSMGIPTPSEAWGMVLNSKTKRRGLCDEGAKLRDAIPEGQKGYDLAILAYDEHTKSCEVCKQYFSTKANHVYDHPLIGEVVRRLGGRENVFTGNITADRARFLEAYQDIVDVAIKQETQLPQIRDFIQTRQLEAPTQIGLLAEKWSINK